jgi:hypothetical protein
LRKSFDGLVTEPTFPTLLNAGDNSRVVTLTPPPGNGAGHTMILSMIAFREGSASSRTKIMLRRETIRAMSKTNANLIWKIADLLRGSTSRTSTAS